MRFRIAAQAVCFARVDIAKLHAHIGVEEAACVELEGRVGVVRGQADRAAVQIVFGSATADADVAVLGVRNP
ncbi:hypothetical protein D3C72_2486450 [compost metagenome]